VSPVYPSAEDLTATCAICGEGIDWSDPRSSMSDAGEFYDPAHPEADSVIAHGECALSRGLVIA